jgi:hypothetical protein
VNLAPASAEARDQQGLAGQQLGLKERDQVGQQFGGFEHAAVTDLAAGLVAAAGAEHEGAVTLDLRHVAFRGRVRPHLAVHGRRDQQRAALDRPRQAHQAQQVVGAPLRELGDEVGTGRCHHDRVCSARDVDVRHVVRLARVPLAGVHHAVRERLHRHRGDELLGRFAHHHLHGGAGLHQFAHEVGGLVAGNAAGEAEHEVLAGEVVRRGVLAHSGVQARDRSLRLNSTRTALP